MHCGMCYYQVIYLCTLISKMPIIRGCFCNINMNPKCVVEVIISRRLPDIRVQTALKLHVIFSFFDKNKPVPYFSKFWRTLKKF